MTAHRKITAILSAKAGKETDLEQLLKSMTSPSRAEPGNLRYDLWRDQDDPSRFVLDELYVDSGAVEAHRATAHFRHYLGLIGDLAERVAVVSYAEDVASQT